MTRSVSRALSIFDAFSADQTHLTLQQISKCIGLAKATTFRLVNTLESEGYLLRLPDQRYCLSPKIVRLAGLVHGTISIRDAARPVMLEINRKTGETITLNGRSHLERVVVDVVDTPSPLMAVARPGERIPLLFGAAGRVLLAWAPEQDRAELIEAILRNSAIAIDELEVDLARIRVEGVAVSRGQRVPGLTAIAGPIIDQEGFANHCLALSGPSVRVDGHEAEFVEIVRAAAQQVSARLGILAIGSSPVL